MHTCPTTPTRLTASRDTCLTKRAKHPAAIPTTTDRDEPRHEATGETSSSRYVALLERDNEFLRDQVSKKDEQIKRGYKSRGGPARHNSERLKRHNGL